MGKVCGRIVIFVMPLLIVLFVYHIAIGSNGKAFLADWPSLYAFFSSAPDGLELVRDFTSAWSDGWDTLINNFTSTGRKNQLRPKMSPNYQWK